MCDDMINVLVVDDSAAGRANLVHALQTGPRICAAGAVGDGQEALAFLEQNRVHLVLMSAGLPRMEGFEAARRIMETRPLPIVMCSGVGNFGEIAATFRALKAGAVAFVERPAGREQPEFQKTAETLCQTVGLMSEVKVVRRWARRRGNALPAAKLPVPLESMAGTVQFVGIGASTGGPPVLQSILAALPKVFPVPILAVQHIVPGFLPGLSEWLSQSTGFPVHIAAHGVQPLPGHMYLAPDGFHMGLNAAAAIQLSKAAPEGGVKPAVSHLFRALAGQCGRAAVGVLLSGMGRDGAAELKLMRDRGAVTIAQDRESSVVHGMPGEAIALGGATHVLAASKIAAALLGIVARGNGKAEGLAS